MRVFCFYEEFIWSVVNEFDANRLCGSAESIRYLAESIGTCWQTDRNLAGYFSRAFDYSAFYNLRVCASTDNFLLTEIFAFAWKSAERDLLKEVFFFC